MKIGILSMQRVINYGSFLQAYALKSTLEELGHSVSFVDIKEGEQIVDRPKKQNVKVLDKHFISRIHHEFFRRMRKKAFHKRFFPQIGIDRPVKEQECDRIVIGSDEVFNCCQHSSWGFSSQLLGDTEVPAITYAASCGHTTYAKVCDLNMKQRASSALAKLAAISVRDHNTDRFVSECCDKNTELHLDPVLIHNWERSIQKGKRLQNYILVYAYDNRINNEAEIEAIRAFAKKHKKKLLSFGVYQRWCDKNILCSPLELVYYFDQADYVITDTFHGSVIAIKRNKKFATIVRDSNQNKLTDLLARFELENREVKDIEKLDSILCSDIDYVPVNEKIACETEKSKAYLKRFLI